MNYISNKLETTVEHMYNFRFDLALFRIQLREEFDNGKVVHFTEEHCPHDVAALFKEFFRDLPDPLLTRDLYEPFISTQSM